MEHCSQHLAQNMNILKQSNVQKVPHVVISEIKGKSDNQLSSLCKDADLPLYSISTHRQNNSEHLGKKFNSLIKYCEYTCLNVLSLQLSPVSFWYFFQLDIMSISIHIRIKFSFKISVPGNSYSFLYSVKTLMIKEKESVVLLTSLQDQTTNQ